MHTSTLHRLSGLALIAAAVGCIAGGLLHPVVDGDAHSVASLAQDREPCGSALLAVGTVLLLLGLPGGSPHGWVCWGSGDSC